MKIAVFSACQELFDEGKAYQDAVRCSENYCETLKQVQSCGIDGIELATCDPRMFDVKAFEDAL